MGSFDAGDRASLVWNWVLNDVRHVDEIAFNPTQMFSDKIKLVLTTFVPVTLDLIWS